MIFHGRKSKAIKRQINVLARLSALNDAKALFEEGRKGLLRHTAWAQLQQTSPLLLLLQEMGFKKYFGNLCAPLSPRGVFMCLISLACSKPLLIRFPFEPEIYFQPALNILFWTKYFLERSLWLATLPFASTVACYVTDFISPV